ncbi:MAG: QueT transporter family protein [Oscillospiraceae bacterium]|nr:QueT transporter family protein [Oscillospiraceae bacterium]
MITKISVRKVAFAGVIAALYAGLTLAVMPLSYGPVQLRISEVLCILPFFFPFSVWGLFAGCIVANLFSPYLWLDITIGPVASLLAALSTMYIGKMKSRERLPTKALACFPPVFFNAVLIGAMIGYILMSEGEAETFFPVFIASMFWVGIGQTVVLYAIGLPLMVYLPKTKLIDKLSNLYGK